MTSQIDPSVIVDDQRVDKADLRAQLQTAKEEITALQNAIAMPNRMAYDDVSFDNL